jgi:hypothetical protein
VIMIAGNDRQKKPEGQETGDGSGEGKPGLLLVVLAFADFILYWVLVCYFPGVMLVLNIPLGVFVLYLRRNPGLILDSLDNLNFSSPGAEWIGKWLSAWVLTLTLGCAFSLYLIF